MRPITVLDGSTVARFRDGLTALPDRRAFDRQRPRAAVDAAPSAILSVDLDGFHAVNEVVGSSSASRRQSNASARATWSS